MNDNSLVLKQATKDLLVCFPNSFINEQGEFIADKKANAYFNLRTCKNYKEVKCKVLEYFSRDTYKSMPFHTSRLNDEFHQKMLDGTNAFLGTDFTEKDMEIIYTYLGNGINRKKTLRFINSDYDLKVLTKKNIITKELDYGLR